MLKSRQIRLEKGMSVPKLVELTGLSRRTIQNIEKSGSCTIANAYKIAQALGVTLNDIYTEEEGNNPPHSYPKYILMMLDINQQNYYAVLVLP